MKAYLVALEIHLAEAGKTYQGLPLHCTLVHWFWLPSRQPVLEALEILAKHQDEIIVHIEDEAQFTGMTKTGPIPVSVNKVKKTPPIADLHEQIVTLLDEAGANYSMPQYIHSGYAPHVTHQKDGRLNENDSVRVKALYIAEAASPEYGNDRTVVARFSFRNKESEQI